MDHVAFWVPVLILPVAENLHKLLQYGGLAAITSLCEARRVVVMTVDVSVVLVVAVLCAERRRAHRAREMVDVVLSIQRRHVRASKGATALVAQEVKPTKIVGFAERILSATVFAVDGKEFRGDDFSAVL